MPGRGRNMVKYVQEDEPSFIKQFKEKIGYKEGPNVNTKRQQYDPYEDDDDDDVPEKEDEKPTVVVLNQGDLTEAQADLAQKDLEKTVQSVDDITSDGKITFKKPVKRSADSSEVPDTVDKSAGNSKKKKKDSEKKSSKSSAKKVKNSSLLSFDDEEEV